ncbi:MAG TPA: hypothetical protein VIL74_01380 [Pyrinomonadaceae bacterium]|jgi:spore germination protein GerM
MKRLILPIAVFTIIAAAVFPATAQPKKRPPRKTREALIFLLKGSPVESDVVPVLVPVTRRVAANAPLAGAMKSLLEGALESDEPDIHGFIFGLKFISAQIKNRTARIDFEYDRADLEEGEEFSWGATMRSFFPDGVERTALQFDGVDRVVVCVEGLESYDSPDDFYHRKCPTKWWTK